MHDTILNIGLRIDDAAGPIEIIPSAVLRAMRSLNIQWTNHRVVESSTETTLVVTVWGAADHLIHTLSDAFDQDCIAVYDMYHREGRLIGPRADKWGEFDPAQFHLLNGSRLSEARSAA